ncbi:hypothetical protein L2U69_16505 [Zavarzinia compransoris]|nr:hypothetical protein [Zavarzinia marina]MCF4167251.1 hypothetical protein [Zavarzinia marina]
MTRGILAGIIAVLLVAVGVFAYQAHEEDKNTFSVEIGDEGIKVDPMGE